MCKMIFKRVLLLLFALLFLCALCSCEKDTEQQIKEDDPISVDYSLFNSLPAADFGGRELTIVTSYPERIVPQSISNTLDSALYSRNKMLEQKYNVTIKTVAADASVAQMMLQSNILAGTHYTHLLYYPQSKLSNMGARGLLLNMYSVPFLNFDAPYIDSEECAALSVNNRLYALYGSAALEEQYYWGVLFNKDIIAELGLCSPFQLYEDGQWTYDKYLELAQSARKDLNKSGSYTADKDRFGHGTVSNAKDYINAVFAGANKSFFSYDEQNLPFMDYKDKDFNSFLTLLKKICKTDRSLYPNENAGEEIFSAFSEDRLLFLAGELSCAASLYGQSVDFGLVPMPKLSEKQEEHHSYVGDMCGFAVPINCEDTEFTGLVLNGLYAASYFTLDGKLYEAFVNHYLRDNDSALVLRDILKMPKYDIAYAFGGGMPEFSSATYELLQSVIYKNLNFNTLYSQNQKVFSDFVKEEFTK